LILKKDAVHYIYSRFCKSTFGFVFMRVGLSLYCDGVVVKPSNPVKLSSRYHMQYHVFILFVVHGRLIHGSFATYYISTCIDGVLEGL